MVLVPGANAPVTNSSVTVTIECEKAAGAEVGFSAFLLNDSGQVRSDDDVCHYGQSSVASSAVTLASSANGRAVFQVELARVPAGVEKIAFAATTDERRSTFAKMLRIAVRLSDEIEAHIPTHGMDESSLILGELYLRQGAWKFRCVGQGFRGGLRPLSEHFGATAASTLPPPSATTQPVTRAVPEPVSLSKISLDKQRPSVSLEKGAESFGEIKVNLNWQRGNQPEGFLSGLLKGRNKEVDLDIGCLYEMQDGRIGIVQALGNCFGDFNQEPFIQLMGDDRTGSNQDGEWLRINGRHWHHVKRVLIYAFIYEGAPNWQATDGVVTLYVPGQPPIEVRVSEEGGKLPACAIALLENDSGSVRISRQVRFFKSQKPMDEAYRWGLRWTTGRK